MISIERYRQILIEELENQDCIPVLLPFDKKFLDKLLFNHVYRRKKFCETLINILPKIDLSNVDFYYFEANDFDFSPYTGIKLDPHSIYNKDLSNSKCKGVNFIGFAGYLPVKFDDVDVSGTDFTGSKGAKINPQTIANKSLENTNCCDVEFIGTGEEEPSFENVNINGTIFEGSNYEPAVIEEKEFRQKIKQIFLQNNLPR